jgi:hypothetical protein
MVFEFLVKRIQQFGWIRPALLHQRDSRHSYYKLVSINLQEWDFRCLASSVVEAVEYSICEEGRPQLKLL